MLKFLDRLAANATSTKWTWRNGALWHVTTYQPNGWEEWKTFDEVARDWYWTTDADKNLLKDWFLQSNDCLEK